MKTIPNTYFTDQPEFFKQLIECSPDAIALAHNEKWIYINTFGMNLFGTDDQDQILNKLIYNFIHPAYHDIERTRLQENTQNNNKLQFIEEKILRLDGIILDVEIAVKSFNSSNGIIFQYIIRDITGIKEYKNELISSEKHFKKLYEYAPDAYLISDLKGNIVETNKSFEIITSYSKEDIINQNLLRSNFIYAQDNPKLANLLLKNSMGEICPPEEILFICKNNHVIPLEIRTFPIRLKSRPLILCIARDISQKKATENELKDSEERFKLLSEATFEGICLSEDLKIIDANLNLANMLGYKLETLLKKNIQQLFHPDSQQFIIDKLSNPAETSYEAIALQKNGNTFPVQVLTKSAPYMGKIIHITAIRDITERKRIEKLKESNELMVRHDLKNPLSAIFTFTEILLFEKQLPEEITELVKFIYDSAQQILRMINHSLDLFKMETGIYKLNAQLINITEIMRELHDEFSKPLKKKNISLNITLNHHPMDWNKEQLIIGETDYVKILFANLLKNAIEASPNNEKIHIEISDTELKTTDTSTKAILVDIHNQGMVPKEIQDTFFERYVTSGKKEGTGLGTYSAKIITHCHNGTISFKTSHEDGTHIYVTLPAYDENQVFTM